ncbi:MAG: hypothetical protein NPIRA02_22970 [Nitrospirales bacterium]|nr:MAG: hypothetical protein NPIRA02_22970 [Nitrospirales bacterium]
MKISKTLKRRRIPYMVIGGQAVLVYGEPRLTRDIDVTLKVFSITYMYLFCNVLNLGRVNGKDCVREQEKS